LKRVAQLLLAINIAYVLALPSTAGRFVALLGILISGALLLGYAFVPDFEFRLIRRPAPNTGRLLSIPLLAFALPALSLAVHPTIAFWRVDSRSMLVVAWLVVLFSQIALFSRDDTAIKRLPLPGVSLLFLFWAACFWLTVIWDVGIGRVALRLATDDRLTFSFDLWRKRPASEHLYLIWLGPNEFAQRVAYTNHLHPYAFALYLVTAVVQKVSGLPLYVGRNVIPFAVSVLGVIAYGVLLSRFVRLSRRRGPLFHVWLLLGVGLIVCERHFWEVFYRVNFDNIMPILADLTAIVWACAQPRLSRRNAGMTAAAAVVFGLFGWVYTPLIVLALCAYFARPGPAGRSAIIANRWLVRASVACAVTGAATYFVPRALVAVKGYATWNTPLLVRSGLDGDVQYFTDPGQAMLQPFNAGWRTAWSVFAAFLPLLLCFVWVARSRSDRTRVFGQIVFLTSPYFFSLALFPQSVSIHPYLYDQLLFVPVQLIAAAWIVSGPFQERMRGPSLLLALLLVGLVIMSDLTRVAQVSRALL
jgi:hypothetical protein